MSRIEAARRRVALCFAEPPTGPSRYVEGLVIGLILLVSAIPVWRAYASNPRIVAFLDGLETVVTSIFLVEYLLRLWVSDRRLRFVLSPYSVIDLIAILPLFLPGTYFQLIRIFRILRILRLVRYLRDEHFFFGSIQRKTLILARIGFTVFAIIFVSAGLVYYAEHSANSKVFRTFGDALYFSIVTMATVGYGDITPVTTYGRWVTVLIIFAGIILLPWQIKDFIEQMLLSATKKQIECPVCTLAPHEPDARFCRRCGAPLAQDGQAGNP